MDPADEIIRHTIGDAQEYKKFIENLRTRLAKDTFPMNGHPDLTVLAQQRPGQHPEQWIYIQLSTDGKSGRPKATTRLAVRNDNLYVKGFMNEDNKWFELWGPQDTDSVRVRDDATKLEDWDVHYWSMLKLIHDQNQARETLTNTRLGKAFAERAVYWLSCFKGQGGDDAETENDNELPTRLGLAGLIVLIFEAARMDPILNDFVDGWNKETTTLTKHRAHYIWHWSHISAALLRWKKNPYVPWDSKCIIDNGPEALKWVRLALNTNVDVESGRTRLEIFAVSANFHVVSIKVSNDQEDKVDIYCTELLSQNQDLEAMPELVLDKVLRNGIFGYKWIEINVKSRTSAGTDGSSIVKMKWDCRKQHVSGATELVRRDIILSDPKRKINVTYMVTSDYVQVEVAVKLRRKDEDHSASMHHSVDDDAPAARSKKQAKKKQQQLQYTVEGKIAARIDGFQDDHKIMLFSSTPTASRDVFNPRKLSIKLERTSVPVPRDMRLHIDMLDLKITETPTDTIINKNGTLSFDFGSSTPGIIDDEVLVDVTWPGMTKTIQADPSEEYIINKEKKAFTDFIHKLRSRLGNNDQHVLPKARAGPPGRWIHIKLQTAEGDEWTTLAVREDKLYGVGFMNKSGVWYDLGKKASSGEAYKNILPEEYNSVLLGWSVNYKVILKATDWDNNVVSILDKAVLGEEFATNAVRILSRYPDVEHNDNPRLALLGLVIMVCESAKLEPIHQFFRDAWTSSRAAFRKELVHYIRCWGVTSQTLLRWMDGGCKEWSPKDKHKPYMEAIGIKDGRVAMDVVRLVFNYRPEEETETIELEY